MFRIQTIPKWAHDVVEVAFVKVNLNFFLKKEINFLFFKFLNFFDVLILK